MRITATKLPGATFGDCTNVHVGVQCKRAPSGVPTAPAPGGQHVISLVRGDAGSASWDIDLDVVDVDAGPDFRGPYAQGKRGDRFVYLSWGDVGSDGSFEMFRRVKLMLGAIDDATLRDARRSGRLSGALELTGTDGTPLCAAVRPPRITWAASTRAGAPGA